jgi:geranylgeranyl transferase type-2 subunit alpha
MMLTYLAWLEFDMMRNALWTDAADQSLWFYHQWLMTTLLDPSAFGTICPHFSHEERIRWVTTQTLDLKDMLDGADEPEWIYKALIECVLGLGRLAGQLPDEDRKDLKIWLAELRNVDPLRRGRWDDLERRLAL